MNAGDPNFCQELGKLGSDPNLIACISVRGARTHNLKNIDLDIPRNRLVVITGLSGSGKSSLAFDTLYAEGQRRYVESLSTYARQFLPATDKPDVDLIEGLSPAIAIEQKATSHNPRSTVGTVTEIHDYLRLMFARAGTPYCPQHGLALQAQSVSQMVDAVQSLATQTRLLILAPLTREKKGEFLDVFATMQTLGYVRFRVDGEVYEYDQLPPLKKNEKHDIDVVVDRLKVHPDMQQRLAESFEAALRLAGGRAIALELAGAMSGSVDKEHWFNAKFTCPRCDYTIAELEPRLFSFNSPLGACPACDGLGLQALPDPAIEHSSQRCPECDGERLNLQARHVKIGAREQAHTLHQVNALTLQDALSYFERLHLHGAKAEIAAKLVKEITLRLKFLNDVGLNYLTLERSADSLSGGESQRIRLASQIGSGLTGVMYVLDEPSIGLHQRDNARLIATLKHLRDIGNSVLVVEHDEDMMHAADQIIDLGPGAGIHGGRVMAQGTFEQIKANADSLTGQYLAGVRRIPVPVRRSTPPTAPGANHGWLTIRKASGHNLCAVDVAIPVGLFTCVTGVSGSGKSTLVNDTLYKAVAHHLYRAHLQAAAHEGIDGLEQFDKVIDVDQSPIGRTPRSNPATYTGLFTAIRELMAEVPTARERGYGSGRFSFNVAGGRCEACQGDGVVKVEMHFLPNVYVTCDVCAGKRYNRETLEVHYKGKNVAQILDLTVEAAHDFFHAIPVLARKLQTLLDVGLSYLKLGQSATTLSGGEAQRVKLALELSKRDTGRTLYILDEPTTGLHFADVAMLLKVLQRLRDAGNTIVVIEHNLDVIKTADYLIDLGPGGGAAGGRVVGVGMPELLAANPASHTGHYLKAMLERG